MTDCFALLGLTRQPWLDPDLLQQRFTALSTQFHPDKIAPAANDERARAADYFAELNLAYQTLRDTRSRLGHLIQLETGLAPGAVEKVSSEASNLFFEVSGLCRKVDQFLPEKAGATSPMLKAAHFAQSLDWTDRLQALQLVIQSLRQSAEEEAHRLNGLWAPEGDAACPEPVEGAPPSKFEAVERLKALYSTLGYLNRWNAQLQERIVQLAV